MFSTEASVVACINDKPTIYVGSRVYWFLDVPLIVWRWVSKGVFYNRPQKPYSLVFESISSDISKIIYCTLKIILHLERGINCKVPFATLFYFISFFILFLFIRINCIYFSLKSINSFSCNIYKTIVSFLY